MKKLLAALLLIVPAMLHAETLTLAAGAGYKRPISELASAFEAASGHKVEVFYGNMAQVLAQTRQSGKVGLILGDLDFLQKTKDIDFASFTPLGEGKLVLAFSKGKILKNPQSLLETQFNRIAIPDAKNAIYGKAASEFLNHAGLFDSLKSKTLVVSTVPQVSAYLISGEVDAGFINLTDALGIQDKIGGFIEIDPNGYSSIKITAATVKSWESNAAIKAFNDYLSTPPARSIATKHGL